MLGSITTVEPLAVSVIEVGVIVIELPRTVSVIVFGAEC